MTMTVKTLRAAVVAALAAALTMALPSAAQARHTDVTKPFEAQHKDRCLSSITAGRLVFKATHPPEPVRVEVTGRLILNDPGYCHFLVPPTAEATFTAYSGRTVVDRERVTTTTGGVGFEFALGPDWLPYLPDAIDRVVLELCHGSSLGTGDSANCARPVTYTPYDFGPTG
ncbi:hypothetical protein [Streptomyces aidingensis]|uniref:Uncharacterized protein n=1 Tax=Streptomyces aidingensis TaxID=910347 RepID=A0A1I1EZ76_9ACTN|nr:hypothetical protein [Streptomyces aidingensis]SFB92499.1 hypothetical protein SAMN05421773_101546 [Streptomyces aidingensis]